MGEEKGKENGSELAFGTLVLLAVLAILIANWLGFQYSGIVIPFVLLVAVWYGESYGFLAGTVSVLFAGLLLFSWDSKIWLNALIIGLLAWLGKGGNENNFLVRVLLASVAFEIVYQLNNTNFLFSTEYYANQWPFILLHLAVNAVIALLLVFVYLQPKD